jgi:hypothetical protein
MPLCIPKSLPAGSHTSIVILVNDDMTTIEAVVTGYYRKEQCRPASSPSICPSILHLSFSLSSILPSPARLATRFPAFPSIHPSSIHPFIDMPNNSGFVDQSSYVNAVSEIVAALIRAYEGQTPINLSRIKGEMAKKHR